MCQMLVTAVERRQRKGRRLEKSYSSIMSFLKRQESQGREGRERESHGNIQGPPFRAEGTAVQKPWGSRGPGMEGRARKAVHGEGLIRARSRGPCRPWQGVGCYSDGKPLEGSEQRPDRL